jgi:hypothetical protein
MLWFVLCGCKYPEKIKKMFDQFFVQEREAAERRIKCLQSFHQVEVCAYFRLCEDIVQEMDVFDLLFRKVFLQMSWRQERLNGLAVVFPYLGVYILEESIKSVRSATWKGGKVDLRISSKAITSPPVALCIICEGGLLPVRPPRPSRIVCTASGLVKMMTVLSKILTFQRKNVVRILPNY